jgi:hypothetical protein
MDGVRTEALGQTKLAFDDRKMPSSARNTVVCFQYPLIEAPNTKDKIGYG